MQRTILWKTIIMDSVPLTDATSYSFFSESSEPTSSIATYTENQAIRWLIANRPFRNDFIREFIPANTAYFLHHNLVEPFTRPTLKPGDIDLLLYPVDDPSRAIAIECKRLKLVSHPDGSTTVNRAGEIDKGIQQANAYRELGFHQTYLLVILLDDGRELATPNPMFRYTTGEPVDRVLNVRWRKERHPDVGVIYIKVNQMLKKDINHAHSIGYFIDERATPREQTGAMTNKIRSLHA